MTGMWTYALLFLFPAAWAVSGRRAMAGRPAAIVVVATALALALFIGLRFRVGGDWHAYWLMLERAHSHDAATALTISDPAYMALNVLAARLGLSIAFVNLVCAALAAAGATVFSVRQPRPWLALLIAVPVLLAVTAMTTTRQSAALGLELLALSWYLDGRRARPAMALILGVAFHWSGAVLLPLIPLLAAPPAWRARLAWLLAALSLAAAAWLWLRVSSQNPAAGGLLRLLPSLLALAVVPLLRRRADWSGTGVAVACYLGGLTLLCVSVLPVAPIAADRLGLYTIALQMLVLPRLPDIFTAPAARRGAISLLVGLYLAMFGLWASFSAYADCMTPYRSYLQEPHRLIEREWPEPVC